MKLPHILLVYCTSVLKYKNTTDVKFREKMAKLTMHSTKKKLQRFSQMVVGVQVSIVGCSLPGFYICKPLCL